ncbi:kinase-like domain-containing protein [Aspergillus recurvatus]
MYLDAQSDTDTGLSETDSEAESGIASMTDLEVVSGTDSKLEMAMEIKTDTNDEAGLERVSVSDREMVSITGSESETDTDDEGDIELGSVKERRMTTLTYDERESVMASIDAVIAEMGLDSGTGIGCEGGYEDGSEEGSVGSVGFEAGSEGGSAESVYNTGGTSEACPGVGSEADLKDSMIDSGFYSEMDMERDDHTEAEASCEAGMIDSGFDSELGLGGNDKIDAEMDAELDYHTDTEMIVIKSDTALSTDSGTEPESDSDPESDMESELEPETDLDREIREKVTKKLSRTKYACSSLTRLRSIINFVYEGVLSKPLNDKIKTVVAKHAEPYLAVNRAWDLRTDRCIGEGTVIKALNEMFDVEVTNTTRFRDTFKIIVRVPELYHINYATHTLIMEHLPNAINLHNFLTNMPCLSDERLHPWCFFVGSNLGHWLHAFHEWIANNQQKQLAKDFDNDLNKAMADLKLHINYEKLLDEVEKYPDILKKKKTRRIFKKVAKMARAEVQEGIKNGRTGPIHGDFWAGNGLSSVILPMTALQDLEKYPKPKRDAEDDPRHIPCPQTTLFITDWEFAQYGPHALDIGRMVAELYILHHFRGIEAASWMLEGFLDGYGHITMETSYRMLIHIGMHFIVWGSRRANGVGTEKQVRKLIKLGRKFIVKGWKKDRYAFMGNFWNCLFKGYSG